MTENEKEKLFELIRKQKKAEGTARFNTPQLIAAYDDSELEELKELLLRLVLGYEDMTKSYRQNDSGDDEDTSFPTGMGTAEINESIEETLNKIAEFREYSEGITQKKKYNRYFEELDASLLRVQDRIAHIQDIVLSRYKLELKNAQNIDQP